MVLVIGINSPLPMLYSVNQTRLKFPLTLSFGTLQTSRNIAVSMPMRRCYREEKEPLILLWVSG